MFKKVSGVLAGLVATTGSAFAAVPASVTTALTDAAADSVTVAGLALAIIVGIAAFKYMRRAI
jgi:VIT1/CCC1 family predicted Fe2+/Mn2+ transporter